MDSLDGNEYRDHNQRERIDKPRQHARALIAKGLLVRRWTRLKIHSHKGKQQRQRVGNVVSGLGDERQRMGAQSCDKGEDHVNKRRRQRKAQDTLHFARWRDVYVHISSLVYRVGRHERIGLGIERRTGTELAVSRSPLHVSATTMLFSGLCVS